MRPRTPLVVAGLAATVAVWAATVVPTDVEMPGTQPLETAGLEPVFDSR